MSLYLQGITTPCLWAATSKTWNGTSGTTGTSGTSGTSATKWQNGGVLLVWVQYLNRNICLSTWDLQGIYRHKVSQDINYDGKRISWHNDYESLQKFIECVFAQQGKWKSAGGTSKKFVSSIADLSCTWYPGKLNSLLFHGKTGDLVNEIMVTVCKSTSFNTFENSVKVCVQNIPVLNSRDTDGMTNSSHTDLECFV
jgi:hypothetical protein